MNSERRPDALTLTEYQTCAIPRSSLTEVDGLALWQRYDKILDVEFPSPKTDNRWEVTPQGWVGHIPVSDTLKLRLLPKVPIANIFGMWEYAYSIKNFMFLESTVGLDRLEDFFEELANVLSKRILDRARRGIYRAYIADADRLAYLRGKLDLNERLRRPWEVRLPCRYQEHTADVEENQILLWTLQTITRGYCSERVMPTVRSAYRALAGSVSLAPHDGDACANRLYSRLNQDYEPMLALCRFFLENTGPTHEVGDRQMMPFLVDMSRLFELFVAEWLRTHLSDTWRVVAQESVDFGSDSALNFQIDIVIRDRETSKPLFVLDTKYKRPKSPSASDVEQIVAYAEALGCRNAALIYPSPLRCPLDVWVGRIHVRSLSFCIDSNLDDGGRALMRDLGSVSLKCAVPESR